jgi:hypothetical protein
MTLLYIIIFAIILLFIYFDYMSSIVRLSLYSNIGSQSSHPLISWVGGRHCVSMVLRRCLPAETPYIPGLVVDRKVALEYKCDTFVESFVVHSSNIGQVGPGCQGRFYAMFINYFISNVPYV